MKSGDKYVQVFYDKDPNGVLQPMQVEFEQQADIADDFYVTYLNLELREMVVKKYNAEGLKPEQLEQ